MSSSNGTGPTLSKSTDSTPHEVATHGGRNPWLAVALLGLVQLMIVLDASITNVALPSIGADLKMDESALSWVVNGYILVFGGLLLLGGRMGDLLGRRKLFMVGLVIFSLASLFSGFATQEWHLIAARCVQGMGGAIIAPSVLAIIASLFTEGPERNKALGVLGAIAGSGGAIGVLLGGILTDKLSWEWIFWVNVPVGLIACALTPFLLDESRSGELDQGFDFFGAITVTSGIAALVYALVDANNAGWGSGQTIGLLVGSAVLLGAFVLIENHVKSPLVRLGIFKNRNVAGSNIVSVVIGAALFSMFFFITLYLQPALGLTPLQTGVRYLPLAVSIIFSAGIASALVTKLGAKTPLLMGLALTMVGLLWFTQVSADGSWLIDVLGPSVVAGAGLGFVFVPITIVAVTGVAHEENGLASGLINTTQQVGGAVGLAALAAVYNHRKEQITDLAPNAAGALSGKLEALKAEGAAPAQMQDIQMQLGQFAKGVTEGVQSAFWGGAMFAFAGLILGIVLIRSGKEDVAAAHAAGPMV